MPRDLFGHAAVQAQSSRRQEKRESSQPAHQREPPRLGRGPPGPAEYFQCGTRNYSRDELKRLLDFEAACRRMADDDLIIVVETTDGRSHAYLIALPRNHPSRLDAAGRPDPARQPFWRHGEVMHIKKQSQPP
ncbi:hypothetical protein [Achromobacter animicus]|uniref:hypothetical protein n=1 Tax=Achromobacter animicus TaxID=1389935 RepID=UPI0028B0B4B6|nr:hypothetical protein [Achromobacter animicus]